MQIFPATIQKPSSRSAAATAIDQPIETYLGWEIFLSRVFRERTDKGWWLHWYHPADRNRTQEHEIAVRYGYFVAPTQTLEESLHAVYQSIDAIVELESMETDRMLMPLSDQSLSNRSERYWQALSIAS